MPVRGRTRLIAKTPNMTKLYVDDLREVVRLSAAENKTMSDLIRELVHEAFRARRLQAIGRDAGENQVRELYQEAAASAVQMSLQNGLAPLAVELAKLRQTIDTIASGLTALTEAVPLSAHGGQAQRWGDRFSPALHDFLAHLLLHLITTKNMARTHLTVAMQRDGLTAEEVQVELARPGEEAQQFVKEFLRQLAAAHRPAASSTTGSTAGSTASPTAPPRTSTEEW